VSQLYQVSRAQLKHTFALLRQCGAGKRECQVLWASPWAQPRNITAVIHPEHRATAASFDLEEAWLTAFWSKLAQENAGVRVQIHTHPGAAFHSGVDDDWPIVQTSGFLSLVIPRFALGEVGFNGAYLAELDDVGAWRQVDVRARIEVTP
jgi:hypothetical protein